MLTRRVMSSESLHIPHSEWNSLMTDIFAAKAHMVTANVHMFAAIAHMVAAMWRIVAAMTYIVVGYGRMSSWLCRTW